MMADVIILHQDGIKSTPCCF